MKRILIVDDELPILTGLSRVLQETCTFQGEIRTVVNGREAIFESSNCFYDICFLDITLPDISGLVVLEDIREASPETNIVMMSGMYARNDIASVLKEKDALFIEKPFNFNKINKIISHSLEGNDDFYKNRESLKHEQKQGKRKFKRKQISKAISFYVRDDNLMEFSGEINDISYAGVGIQTYYPLERGQILFFSKGVSHKTGIVSWSTRKSVSNCHAGIKFIQN